MLLITYKELKKEKTPKGSWRKPVLCKPDTEYIGGVRENYDNNKKASMNHNSKAEELSGGALRPRTLLDGPLSARRHKTMPEGIKEKMPEAL